jgi:hypothetical protein
MYNPFGVQHLGIPANTVLGWIRLKKLNDYAFGFVDCYAYAFENREHVGFASFTYRYSAVLAQISPKDFNSTNDTYVSKARIIRDNDTGFVYLDVYIEDGSAQANVMPTEIYVTPWDGVMLENWSAFVIVNATVLVEIVFS